MAHGSGLRVKMSDERPYNLPFQGLIEGNHKRDPPKGRLYRVQVGFGD